MKKLVLMALVLGLIPINALFAQSDFELKKHIENRSDSGREIKKPIKTNLEYGLPFEEDFESNTFPPNDWISFIGTNGAGNNYNWELYENWYYNISCAFVYWENLGGTILEDWLVTPLITLGENTTLSFIELQDYEIDYNSEYSIRISTNSQTTHSDFVTIASYGEDSFSDEFWSERVIDLSAYDGQDVYIAFVMTNDDGDSWYIDDISITEDPGGGGVPDGDLLISEIAYPYDSGKDGRFIELYNSGDESIDLTDYYIAFYKNTWRINLSGTIGAGQTYTYAPDKYDFNNTYGYYPNIEDQGISNDWFNGNDAIYLLQDNGDGSYSRRDTYGVKRTNGDGTEWDYEGMHAVRKANITEYQRNFDIDEWEISTAYSGYRDVTPGNHNDTYVWTGDHNNEWDEYRNWYVNTDFSAIPDAGSNVVIPSGTNYSPDFGAWQFPYYFNSLSIESGASFTIKGQNILEVIGDVTIESGAELVLESTENGTAAFIPNGTVNGEANIQRWFPSIGGVPTNGRWHYISPPSEDISSNLFLNQYLMYWDEPTTYWQYITATDETLIPGMGYGVLLNDEYGQTINMSGAPLNEDIISPILNSTDGSGWQGWNLIGNPYTASLDWEEVLSNLPEGIDAGIHFYDETIGNYVFYNGGEGSASQYIPAMQGFFIHTNTDQLQFTIPASARTYQGQEEFYKSRNEKPFFENTPPPKEVFNRLIVTSTSENGKSDQTFLKFHPKASVDFDFQFDAYKFDAQNDSIPVPYILYNNTKYAINALPENMIEGRYDLCINYGIANTYYLSFEGIESFAETQTILLYDKFTNTYYDLREDNFISFLNESSTPENRFEIVFDNYLSIPEQATSQWLVYSTNGKLNIRNNLQSSGVQQYQIISMEGKLIEEGKFTSNLINHSVNVSQNIFIVKILDGQTPSTYKVLLKD
jgi:hypothetical protein